MSQFALSFCSVLGTVALVFYGMSKFTFSPCSVLRRVLVFPYLGILFVPLTALYLLASIYYRRTSVETKRMDSLLRSALYASYSGILVFTVQSRC
jgi:hypothetical protein